MNLGAEILAESINNKLSADIIYTIIIVGLQILTVYTVSIFSEDFKYKTENHLKFRSPRFRINQMWFVSLMAVTYQLSLKNERDEIKIANLLICGIYSVYLLWDEFSYENFEYQILTAAIYTAMVCFYMIQVVFGILI